LLIFTEELAGAGELEYKFPWPDWWPSSTARFSRDDPQDVGRRAREILIDCSRLLADPSLVPAGQPFPKAAVAKTWLDLFLAARASGSNRDELRRFIRAAWDLAQTVTHGDIERVEAIAAAPATVLVVRTLQTLAGVGAPPAPSAW